jgi:primary-amine oxidase
MMQICFRSCLAGLFLALLAGSAPAQSRVPQHPLEALTFQEYWTVRDVLRDNGKLDEDTFIPGVLLHEPTKDRVLAWKPGDPVFRVADVILLRKGLTIEARVDIAGRKLLLWKERPDVYAPESEEEYREMGEAIKKNPEVVQALKKRGFTDLTTVKCGATPLGYFALPELEGHRILFGGCSDLHGAYLHWSRTIEGLHVEMDAADKKILKVVDEGAVPMQDGTIDYEEATEPTHPETNPIEIRQPAGSGFKVTNGEVSWQNWRFRFRLDPRVGAVLNLVRLEDGGRTRSVMYEGGVSELYVPYMDPATGWATRVFIDAGEFFPGGVLTTLRQGLDCPPNASYFDAVFSDDHGFPTVHSREACLFELATGQPTWRHFEKEEVWGRPNTILVLRTAMVIGNYDYMIDWRFEPNGAIRGAVGATGIIEAKHVKEKTAAAVSGAARDGMGGDQYGHFVKENIVGVNHDHFFSFRLDLDIDGPNNTFMADHLVRRELKGNPARKTIWAMEPFFARTEKDAMMDIHLDRPTMWRIVNPNAKGPLGYPTGYEIMPGVTAASLLDPDDGPQKVGAFSGHQLWVTPYKPDELYASGVFPTASKGNDGLAVWTKANRPIENADIVAWYTMGFHHVPRAEDWPVMPVMWHDFLIRPYDFFPANPALDLPKSQ